MSSTTPPLHHSTVSLHHSLRHQFSPWMLSDCILYSILTSRLGKKEIIIQVTHYYTFFWIIHISYPLRRIGLDRHIFVDRVTTTSRQFNLFPFLVYHELG